MRISTPSLRYGYAVAAVATSLAALGAGGTGSTAATQTDTTQPRADRYVRNDAEIAAVTAAANTGEVQQAQLAQQRATNAQVRAVADAMVADHTQAIERQTALEQRLQLIPVPTETSRTLTRTSASTIRALRGANPAGFDRLYMGSQVENHRTVLSLLDDHLVPAAQNAELRTMLQTMRITVARHLQRAQQIQSTLASGAAAHGMGGTP